MAALVDTNILVYRFDPRFPEKQARAAELLRAGIADDSIRVPHQALIEFIAAYAERFGLDTLWSEDFEDGRLYGRVRTRDPFLMTSA